MPDFLDVWWQPFLGALHVLGIAWFGATLLADAPLLRRLALAWMLLTGALLYLANADRLLSSTSFRIKLALIAIALLIRKPRWLTIALWIAVIFAARGIAYF